MLGQSVAALFVLLALIFFLWVMRRRGLASFNFALTKRLAKEKFMQVVERVPLTANHSLHLVRIQDRLILVGVSPSGCTQLDSFRAPTVVMQPEERL